jgi:PAS domain S-box-containing protein
MRSNGQSSALRNQLFPIQHSDPASRRSLRMLALGTSGALLLLAVNTYTTFRNIRQLRENAASVDHTHEVIDGLNKILSLATDAETGQRGFVITGRPQYLEPYNIAVANLDQEMDNVMRLTADNPTQQQSLTELQGQMTERLDTLAQVIDIRQSDGFEAAQRRIATGEGRREMEILRAQVNEMVGRERLLLQQRSQASARAFQSTLLTSLLSGLLSLAAVGALVEMLRRYLNARSKSAAMIAEQAERLRTTLASIGDAVITTDAQGQVVNMNAVAESLTGWQQSEANGRSLDAVFRIINEDTRQAVDNPAVRALREGIIVGLANHTLLIAKDGTERPIDDSAAPIRTSDNNIVGCVLVFRDITERQQAERQLRESERRFRQMTDVTPQLIWVTRPDGFTEFFNRRWYEYLGATEAECLGWGWGIFLHPDDYQPTLDRWNYSVQTGEPYEVEYRFRSADGDYRWFLGRGLPVRDESGQIVNWFGVCTDIDDFKRLQEERQNFFRLADNSTDFISMCDLAGVPFYANPAALKKIGIEQLEDLYQLNTSDFFFPEDREKIINEFFPSVLANGTGTTEIRFRHTQSQAAIWMVYNVTALSNAKGEPIGLATISQDVTERRQLEQNLRQLAADLSEADQRKDEFLATLAHELRNPLAPIRNGLQIMRMTQQDSETAERVRAMMERQLTQMVRLVDDLLDVSRISRGQVTLRRQRVTLAEIVNQAVETSRPVIESANHELRVRLPEPVYLYADPVRLTQVISNLLNNASKYSEPSGEIVLSAAVDNQEVSISVKDTGIGIAAEMLPRIFEMFTQVEGALARSQGGLGIGLTLVKQLVEMHGGSVSAFSDGPGLGSEFVVRLPIVVEPTEPLAPTASEHRSMNNRRILIVDDNEDSALSLSMLFEITGDETQTVYTGPDALSAAQTFQPDIVLLDIGLPGLNGYEVAQAIRAQPWGQTMVLVALTGWGQEEDRRKSSEAGFNAHMVKPIEHDALLQLLDELMA